MFRLKKLHPPFGTAEAPQYESAYSEGMIKVVDGFCSVEKEPTRDYLLKIGYEEVEKELAAVGVVINEPSSAPPSRKKPKPKKKHRR